MTKVCRTCNQEKELEAGFHKRARSKDGFQPICKECNKDQRKAYYKTAHGRAIDIANGKRSQALLRLKVFRYLQEHSCVDCGESDPIVLEFDHSMLHQKTMSISTMIRRGLAWSKIEEEIAKCAVRCANCHKRRTAIQFGWFKALMAGSSNDRASLLQSDDQGLIP